MLGRKGNCMKEENENNKINIHEEKEIEVRYLQIKKTDRITFLQINGFTIF